MLEVGHTQLGPKKRMVFTFQVCNYLWSSENCFGILDCVPKSAGVDLSASLKNVWCVISSAFNGRGPQ